MKLKYGFNGNDLLKYYNIMYFGIKFEMMPIVEC
jgi:hypothetical protein